ncbi:P2Y purinoceptor 1-like [Lampetra planeri]
MVNYNLSRCYINELFSQYTVPLLLMETAVGFLGNAFALWIIVWRIKDWTCFTIYMLNLVLSDLLFVLVAPVRSIYYMYDNQWPFGEAACDMLITVTYISLYGSIFFLTCISAERYFVIVHPTRAFRNRSLTSAKLVSLAGWVTVLGGQLSLPFIFHTTADALDANATRCMTFNLDDLYPSYNTWSSVVTIAFFLVPFTVMSVFHGLITHNLLYQAALGVRVARARRRAARLVVLVQLIVAICFTPLHVVRPLMTASSMLTPTKCDLLQDLAKGFFISMSMSGLNSCLDPLLFYHSGGKFRKEAKAVVMTLLCRGCVCPAGSRTRSEMQASVIDVEPSLNSNRT